MEERVMFIIDQANLSGMIKKLTPEHIRIQEARTDFELLVSKLFGSINYDQIKKIIITRYPRMENFANFCLALEGMGFVVYCPDQEIYKGDTWDDDQITIILNSDRARDEKIKAICLLSGDGVFIDPLKNLQELGKEIYVIGTEDCTNKASISQFNFIDLESIIGEIVNFPQYPEVKIGARKKRIEDEDGLPLIDVAKILGKSKEIIVSELSKTTNLKGEIFTEKQQIKLEINIIGKIDVEKFSIFTKIIQELIKHFPMLKLELKIEN